MRAGGPDAGSAIARAESGLAGWLGALLEQAAEAGARKALAESGGPRLVPIREAPVPYRAILAAERAGEIRVYRRGRTSWVDSVELDEWIRRAPVVAPEEEPEDEVDQIITANRRRGGR